MPPIHTHLCQFLVWTALSVAVTLASAEAALFNLQPEEGARDVISLSGIIETGDAARLEAAVAVRANPDRALTLKLDSPGGNLIAGLDLADFVNRNNIATYVGDGSRCESACSIVFMAGASIAGSEKLPDRMLHPNGRLGFHAPSFSRTLFEKENLVTEENVAQLERIILDAATRFYDLIRLHRWQPSLVRETLSTDGDGEMLYVETVGQAGRWLIRIDSETPLRLFGSAKAAALCSNLHNWLSDGGYYRTRQSGFEQFLPPEQRTGKLRLESETLEGWKNHLTDRIIGIFADFYGEVLRLGHDGLTDSCVMEVDQEGAIASLSMWNDHTSTIFRKGDSTEAYETPVRDGRYLSWHVLPPFIRLAELSGYLADPVIKESKWDHNTSTMLLSSIRFGNGDAYWRFEYFRPKPSLGDLVRTGTLLFEGSLRDGRIEGEARTFKTACPVALYQVSGRFNDQKIMLSGPAPIRARGGCKVVRYSKKSGNARLPFVRIAED